MALYQNLIGVFLDFLYIVNDFLKWFELYKGHVFLILAILDSCLVYKIAQMDQEKLKANIYLSTHFKIMASRKQMR